MILSICMMVKDEQKNIRRCLDSLEVLMNEVDSELIVVDTGSKDNTVEIVKEYTNNVYFHHWNNNFSEIRNISISYAKGSWIYIIDADEELLSAAKLVEFLNDDLKNSKYNTVGITGKNFLIEGNENETALISTLRLFRNGAIRYEGSVHNQCIFKKPIIHLDVLFNHYGYVSNNKELMDRKFNRTSDILKNELNKDPRNIYYLYQLATSYEMHLDYRDALKVIVKAYSILDEEKLDKSDYKYIYYRYASIENNFKDWSIVKKICNEGINVSKEYIDLYFLLAQAQSQLEEWEESLKSYNIYFDLLDSYDDLTIKMDTSIMMYTLNMREQALNNACVCYLRLEKYEEAFNYASKIQNSEIQQKSIPVLIKSALKIKKEDELLKYYESNILSKNDIAEVLFQTILEDCLIGISREKIKRVTQIFSKAEGLYSDFNRIRLYILEDKLGSAYHLIQKLVINNNWNEVPNFYGQVIYFSLRTNYPLENLFARIYEYKINEFLEYCASKFLDLCELIKDTKFEALDEIEIIKKNKIFSRCLLIIDSALNDDEYNNYFILYARNGIKYMQKIYNEFILTDEVIFELKGNEEIFFLYMFKAEKFKIDNPQKYLSYLRKALEIYPKMIKGIEFLRNDFNGNNAKEKNEFNELKKQFKMNISLLIDQNKLEDARIAIQDYEEIVGSDVDILLYKSEILVKETKL